MLVLACKIRDRQFIERCLDELVEEMRVEEQRRKVREENNGVHRNMSYKTCIV